MNSPHGHPPLAYSIADACRLSSLGRTRLYQLISENRIATKKIGNRRLVLAVSLQRLIEEGDQP